MDKLKQEIPIKQVSSSNHLRDIAAMLQRIDDNITVVAYLHCSALFVIVITLIAIWIRVG